MLLILVTACGDVDIERGSLFSVAGRGEIPGPRDVVTGQVAHHRFTAQQVTALPQQNVRYTLEGISHYYVYSCACNKL